MIFLCRLIDSSSNISQSLAFVKHFFNFFQFIVFNNSELFLLLLQFSLLFLSCICCVCVVFSDVDYNTTLQRVCQQVFSFFLQLESSKEIISSLLFPNTKKAGTDSFSSIPALKPRYPLDNTSFFGCQLFRFRNKISFWFFSLFLIRFVFTIQLFVDSSCKNIFFFF